MRDKFSESGNHQSQWREAIKKGRAYTRAHPEPSPTPEWKRQEANRIIEIELQAKRRSPGDALCALMARLYRADGKFGERIEYCGDWAIVISKYRDIVYVPWQSSLRSAGHVDSLTIGGDIYVVLGDPIPACGVERGTSTDHWKHVHHRGSFTVEGPWWAEISNVIAPALLSAVEAAEAEQLKARIDRVAALRARDQARLDAWSARRVEQ